MHYTTGMTFRKRKKKRAYAMMLPIALQAAEGTLPRLIILVNVDVLTSGSASLPI